MRRKLPVIGALFAVSLLVGCGGGGGGGSESPYAGLTSQASLTQDNVVDITTEAYRAGDLATSAVTPLGESGPPSLEAGNPRVIALVRTLRGVVERVEVAPLSASEPMSETRTDPLVVETVSDTIFDGFGGSLSFTLSVDTGTGDFFGTFTFSNWLGEGGGGISGTTSVTGHYDLSTGEFTRIRFTFRSVTMVDGADSVTITGTVELTMSISSGNATVEIYLEDNGTGETVWVHAYNVVTTEGPDTSPFDGIPDYSDVAVSGRIYLHDYGYVDVSTPTPFRFSSGSTNPEMGVLQVDGSLGRSAQLVVISEVAGYFIQADLDANGSYEWVSPDFPWV
jgi:hypothetical protein